MFNGVFKKTSYISIDMDREDIRTEPSVPDGMWEKCPGCSKAVYAEDTHTHWKSTGKKATQYWYCSNPSSELEGVVNGRYTYWASKSPIPGGIAYENFELTEPFQSGQSYIFGITPLSSEELINHIMK